jgi:hypothetical protein
MTTVLLLGLSLGGCDGDDLVPIAWTGVQHFPHTPEERGQYLQIEELLGPEGATIDSPLPGTYIVRGMYDLTELDHTWEVHYGLKGDMCSELKLDRLQWGQWSGSFELSCESRDRDRRAYEREPWRLKTVVVVLETRETQRDHFHVTEEVILYGEALAAVPALASVVLGQGVPGAAIYSPGTAGPHPVVLLDKDGRQFEVGWGVRKVDNRLLPAGWFPSSVGEAELVAVFDSTSKKSYGQRCFYDRGPAIDRFHRDLIITLRAAKTGQVIASTTLQGPRHPCPDHAPAQQTETYSGIPSKERIESWLRTYVAP